MQNFYKLIRNKVNGEYWPKAKISYDKIENIAIYNK